MRETDEASRAVVQGAFGVEPIASEPKFRWKKDEVLDAHLEIGKHFSGCPREIALQLTATNQEFISESAVRGAYYHAQCGISPSQVASEYATHATRLLEMAASGEIDSTRTRMLIGSIVAHMESHNEEFQIIDSNLRADLLSVEQVTVMSRDSRANYLESIETAFLNINGVFAARFVDSNADLTATLVDFASHLGASSLISLDPDSSEILFFGAKTLINVDTLSDSGFFSDIYVLNEATGDAIATVGSIAVIPFNRDLSAPKALLVLSGYKGFLGKRITGDWFLRWRDSYVRVVESASDRRRFKTERNRLEQLRIFYNSLLQGEELALRAKTESDLMNGMCSRIASSEVFLSAWVARPDSEGKFRVIASRGAGVKTLKVFELSTGQSHGSTIYERAWRDAKIHFNNDYINDPELHAWKEFLSRFKWRSAAAVPIFKGDKIDSVLVAISSIANLFDEQSLDLVSRFGKLMGAALTSIERERELRTERQRALDVAQRDYLTGLPNRLHLDIHMPKVLARAKRYGHLVGVVVLDLDGFKPVNDNFGHEMGDVVLQATAARLAQAARKSDFVARSGGDEFVIVFDDLKNREGLKLALVRLKSVIEAPIILPGGDVIGVSASMGATLFPYDDSSSGTLLRHADSALYRVKQEKTNKSSFYMEYTKTWERSQSLPKRGARGLDQKIESGLTIYYQPIVAPTTGKTVRLEALARIKSGTELLDPHQFLPRLSPKQIMRLSLIVLDQVLGQLRAWDDQGVGCLAGISVSVNMLPENFLEPNLFETVRARLVEYGIEPHRLYLEVLETGEFLSLSQARETIATLRNLGVKVSLDDLGSAYAGLLRLRDLLFDEVKLDKSFVQKLQDNPRDLQFVRSIQLLVASLGIDLVVEGVEDVDTLTALHFLGVPFIQGFIYERPLPVDQLVKFCENAQPISPTFASPPTDPHVLTMRASEFGHYS